MRGVRTNRTLLLARSLAIALLVAVMIATPLFAALPPEPRPPAGALKIGALFPFTGDLTDFGTPFWSAAKLAVAEINEAGGVNGLPVVLVRGDTGSDPGQAAAEARHLIDVGANALIGPASNAEVVRVTATVAARANVPLISPSATSPALTTIDDHDFLFRTTISDVAQGIVMADLASEHGYASACVLYVDDAYGRGLADAFATRFAARGGKLSARVSHPPAQESYTRELKTCFADDPDVLVGISDLESGETLLRELAKIDELPALMLSDGFRSGELFEDLGWEHFEGTMGASPGVAESETSSTFVTAYEAMYGEFPATLYVRGVYDAVYLIALAAETAGSNDPAAIRDAIRDVSAGGAVVTPGAAGFAAAVTAIAAGDDINYEGAAGAVDLDAAGDVSKGAVLIWGVAGGAIEVLEMRDIDLSGGAGLATPAATPAN